MKLSIITINYNNAPGLRKTMESVVNQTSPDFEYIIVDGGSTDKSTDVIQEFATSAKKNKTGFASCKWLSPTGEREGSIGGGFISEPDTGIYNAMNKGIKAAKGEYCQFLNSGDFLVNSSVTERMLEEKSDCSILYGNMLKLMPGNKILSNKKIPVNSFLTFYTGTLNHSSAYIKRSLFDKYGNYDEKLRIVSDWKFFMTTIGLHNESVVYRNIDVSYFDMNGISNTHSTLDKSEQAQVLKEVLPRAILNDYEKYAFGILQLKRINRYKLTKWTFWFIERVLFKYEQFKSKLKKEHIVY